MSLIQDVRLAVRGLVRSPGFAVVAVVTLALGIGANAAIFSVLRAVLLRPLPYVHAEELVVVNQGRQRGDTGGTLSDFDFVDWRKTVTSFADLAAWHDEQLTLVGADRPERLRGIAASANLFDVLGARPAHGRGFARGEDTSGQNHVAVLGHGAWLRMFGGDPAVVGRTVTLDDIPFTVVGVLGADFRFPMRDQEPDIWVPRPRPWDDAMIPQRGATYLSLVGRLAPGATLTTAQAELDTEVAREAAEFPEELSNRSATVRPLRESLVASVRPALLLLFGAVGFVLLIACANVANLLLARAGSRQREIAIRAALGAGQGRIVRAFLVESLVLGLAGATVGVLLALWGLDALRTLIPASIAAIGPIHIDGSVLAFTLVTATATSVLFGIGPALHAAAADPQDALRDAGAGGRASANQGRQRARSILVTIEIAVAAVLLVGATLVIVSFTRLVSVDPGVRVDGVVTSNVFLPDGRYRERDRSFAFYQALLEKLEAIPGAIRATVAFPLPFSDMRLGTSYQLDGEPKAAPGHEPSASMNLISPGFFATLEIPLRAGRTLATADDHPDAAPVAVIGERLARRLVPGGAAVGRRLTIDWNGERVYEVVGVVGDVRTDGLHNDPRDEIYLPFGQIPFPFVTFAIRTSLTGDQAPALAAAVQSIDSAMPIAPTSTLATALRGQLSRQRLTTTLLGIFGALALALALVGVYGVMVTVVAQRRHEIGIRMALGARAGAVTWMIVGQAVTLAGIGAAVGLGAALLLARLLQGLLHGVSATEPAVFVIVGPSLVAVAALAAYLPARSAAATDPLTALRAE